MRLAFSNLPMGLRRLLGPDFVRRLAAQGYDDDAADVREALSRGTTIADAEALVLRMETTDEQPTRRDTEALAEQLQTAGPDVSRVMREYLAARRQANDPPEADQLVAAEALLREIELDFSENSLWHEVLLAHTALGDMDTAFPMLDLLGAAPLQDMQAIQTSVVEILLRRREDAALVVMSSRLASDPNGHGLPNSIGVRVHERLQQMGLNELAEPFYPGAFEQPGTAIGPNDPDWASMAENGNGAAASVARRVTELEGSDATLDTEEPDAIRAAVEDSRSLRAELAELLGGPAN